MFKNFFLVLSTVFLFACSSTPKVEDFSRVPASVEDYELLDDEFMQRIITSLNSGLVNNNERLPIFVESGMDFLMDGVYRGYDLMEQFDADLAKRTLEQKDFDIFADPTYAKLQSLREIVHRTEWRLSTGYAHAWKVRLGKVDDEALKTPEAKAGALKIIKTFHDYVVQRIADEERAGFQELGEQLVDLRKHLSSEISLLGTTPGANTNVDEQANLEAYKELGRVAKRIHFDKAKDLQDNYTRNKEAMKKAALKLRNQPSEMKTLLEKMSDRVLSRQKRTPQSTFTNWTGSHLPTGNWVLTYDDGPHKSNTAKIRKLLNDYRAPAEFFHLSSLAVSMPEIVKENYRAGHGIQNHSYNHPDLSKAGNASLDRQIITSKSEIESVVGGGYRVKYFRCPYGAGVGTERVKSRISGAGMIHVMWNVDSLDWKDKTPSSVLNRVRNQMKTQKKGIILFHDIHGSTVTATELLLKNATDAKWVRLP